MNINQLEYFVEVAECKNITEAAKNLHITQPTLGRQMSAIESELNLQLFIRTNKGLQLTPAAIMFQKRAKQILKDYNDAVKEAQLAMQGMSGTLKIGILEGLSIHAYIPQIIEYFRQTYPNINISINRYSFGQLLTGLQHKELDVGFSLDINFAEEGNINVKNVKSYQPVFIVPKSNPLAKREKLYFRDFKDEPLVEVCEQECMYGVKCLQAMCKEHGGFNAKFFEADTMSTAVLWVEAGMMSKIGNMDLELAKSEAVKVFPIEEDLSECWIQVGYGVGNENFAVDILLEYLSQMEIKE